MKNKLSKLIFMLIPCSPQGHASEFVTVTNLSRFGYFPAEKEMNVLGLSKPGWALNITFHQYEYLQINKKPKITT